MKFKMIIAILLLNLLYLFNGLDQIRADNQKPYLYDQFGRVRIFHGVNRVQKGPPFYPEDFLNETRLDELKVKFINIFIE